MENAFKLRFGDLCDKFSIIEIIHMNEKLFPSMFIAKLSLLVKKIR
jgi:hypothetical protein